MNVSFRVEEHIVRFHISMNDALLVNITQGTP